jgi:hypothetical protein
MATRLRSLGQRAQPLLFRGCLCCVEVCLGPLQLAPGLGTLLPRLPQGRGLRRQGLGDGHHHNGGAARRAISVSDGPTGAAGSNASRCVASCFIAAMRSCRTATGSPGQRHLRGGPGCGWPSGPCLFPRRFAARGDSTDCRGRVRPPAPGGSRAPAGAHSPGGRMSHGPIQYAESGGWALLLNTTCKGHSMVVAGHGLAVQPSPLPAQRTAGRAGSSPAAPRPPRAAPGPGPGPACSRESASGRPRAARPTRKASVLPARPPPWRRCRAPPSGAGCPGRRRRAPSRRRPSGTPAASGPGPRPGACRWR